MLLKLFNRSLRLASMSAQDFDLTDPSMSRCSVVSLRTRRPFTGLDVQTIRLADRAQAWP